MGDGDDLLNGVFFFMGGVIQAQHRGVSTSPQPQHLPVEGWRPGGAGVEVEVEG